MWLNGVETVVDRRHRRLQGLWEDKLDHRLVSRRPLRQQDYSPLISGPKLRSLISGKIPGEKTAGQVLARLASHKIYEELFVWGMEIDLEAVTFMLSALVERPICPKLKHFGAYMWVDAARALFPYLPASLTSLFLGVGTLTEPWFHLVTQFRCLESLTIVGRDELLRMFPIYYLGRLGCLRNLAIALLPVSEPEEYIWFGAQATPFTDNDFEAMTSGLPLLQTFELKLPCELSLPALTSLATNCPLLEQCTLSTTISFTEWEEAGHPEFPNLSVLLLTRRVHEDTWSSTRFMDRRSGLARQTASAFSMEDEPKPAKVGIIVRHCPNLSRLRLYSQDYGMFELGQLRAWEGRRRWWGNVLSSAF
ncbi:hypothetical protein KCU73_g5974, partial [Aureobasidium melanogenum]